MRKWFISILFAAGLASCTTVNGVTQIDPNFLASIQADAAAACKVIPTIDSIVAIFNSGIATTIQAITSVICQATPPAASARYKALPKAGSGGPAQIGIVNGIVVNGWRV